MLSITAARGWRRGRGLPESLSRPAAYGTEQEGGHGKGVAKGAEGAGGGCQRAPRSQQFKEQSRRVGTARGWRGCTALPLFAFVSVPVSVSQLWRRALYLGRGGGGELSVLPLERCVLLGKAAAAEVAL